MDYRDWFESDSDDPTNGNATASGSATAGGNEEHAWSSLNLFMKFVDIVDVEVFVYHVLWKLRAVESASSSCLFGLIVVDFITILAK